MRNWTVFLVALTYAIYFGIQSSIQWLSFYWRESVVELYTEDIYSINFQHNSSIIKMAQKIILFACGSFNPPTSMHLRMFGELFRIFPTKGKIVLFSLDFYLILRFQRNRTWLPPWNKAGRDNWWNNFTCSWTIQEAKCRTGPKYRSNWND